TTSVSVRHSPTAMLCTSTTLFRSDAQTVVRERILVEEMPEAAVEGIVLVVADFEHTVLDAKRVGIIDAMFVTGDLGGPAIEVFAVEQLDPLFFVGAVRCRGGGG